MHFGIIAAGEGSRLAGEGAQVSKPLLPVQGQPMIGRLIDIFVRAGATSINVVINDFMPDVREYLEKLREALSVPLNLKIKSTPSSMHTFHELAGIIPDGGRFIATTVDTIFREEDFIRYVKAFENEEAGYDGMMAVTDYVEDEKPLYVGVDSENNILAFKDAPERGDVYVSGGIYGLDGKAIEILDACMERGVARMRNFQRALIEGGLRLKAYPMGKIIDVDHLSDLQRADEFLEEKI